MTGSLEGRNATPAPARLRELHAATWQQAVDQLASSTPSQLALPKFELEWDATLNDALQDLGIAAAFGGGDFTPMSSANPWLDAVVQKTYIRGLRRRI